VSGKVLENLRNSLLRGDPEGEYQWDYLDGLSDLNEELQNKIKTAIIEGKIADEDFNGVSPHYCIVLFHADSSMPGSCF
jgi:hypothetical protein